MEQKFKRGNLVKALVGHQVWIKEKGWTDIAKDNCGRLAIIEGSYRDLYGSGGTDQYSIFWQDNGTSEAWKHDSQLELVEEGGEHLLVEAIEKRKELSRRNKDLSWIYENWKESNGSLNSESIVFLFDKIGHITPFDSNGEYFSLYSSWKMAYPMFDVAFKSNDKESLTDVLINAGVKKPILTRLISLFEEIELIRKDVR